jgi:hypothetical protein
MSNQATEFVNRWEFANVKVITDSRRAGEAQRLAAKCREDAAKAGISAKDLEAAVHGDLVANMRQALDAAALRHMAMEQWASNE